MSLRLPTQSAPSHSRHWRSILYSCCHPFSHPSHFLFYETITSALSSLPYLGYADGASHYSRHLASAAWAIFTPLHTLVLANGVCIGTATNNQAEYDAFHGLLVDALSHRILHLHVHLDSLLVVLQLNGVYRVHNPLLFRQYLRVKILIREFRFITFHHIPRDQIHYVDQIANHILDWYLSHTQHNNI